MKFSKIRVPRISLGHLFHGWDEYALYDDNDGTIRRWKICRHCKRVKTDEGARYKFEFEKALKLDIKHRKTHVWCGIDNEWVLKKSERGRGILKETGE